MADGTSADKGSKIQNWEMILIVALISDVLIVMLNGIISYVTLGTVSFDYLMLGMVDAMVVPIITAPFIVYLFNEERAKVKILLEQAKNDMAMAKEASEKALLKLHEADAKINDLERLRADFFGTVSTEINVPLTTMLMGANKVRALLGEDVLKSTDDRSAKSQLTSSTELRSEQLARVVKKRRTDIIDNAKDTIEMLLFTGNKLASMLNVVVELAGIDTGISEWKEEELDLLPIVQKAAQNMAPMAKGRGLYFKEDINNTDFTVKGDPDKLHGMITNLFDNAIALTEAGGITYRLRKEVGKVIFELEDTGWEIPAYMFDSIFGKASHAEGTASDRVKRTTLILTLCRKIAERHMGEIWLESKSGVGNKVVVILPMVKESAGLWKSTSR